MRKLGLLVLVVSAFLIGCQKDTQHNPSPNPSDPSTKIAPNEGPSSKTMPLKVMPHHVDMMPPGKMPSKVGIPPTVGLSPSGAPSGSPSLGLPGGMQAVAGPRLTPSSTVSENGKHCSLTPCNSLRIECLEQPPPTCSAIYELGDFCRALVKCEFVKGKCTTTKDKKFAACEACIKPCNQAPNPPQAQSCEDACKKKFGMEDKPQNAPVPH